MLSLVTFDASNELSNHKKKPTERDPKTMDEMTYDLFRGHCLKAMHYDKGIYCIYIQYICLV